MTSGTVRAVVLGLVAVLAAGCGNAAEQAQLTRIEASLMRQRDEKAAIAEHLDEYKAQINHMREEIASLGESRTLGPEALASALDGHAAVKAVWSAPTSTLEVSSERGADALRAAASFAPALRVAQIDVKGPAELPRWGDFGQILFDVAQARPPIFAQAQIHMDAGAVSVRGTLAPGMDLERAKKRLGDSWTLSRTPTGVIASRPGALRQ